jgi:hypothetical protein
MDQTTYSDHLTVPHGDDAPFAEERYRYLRHCAEASATAASLQRKRNELLWIAARIGPDASEGIDIETLMKADALARVDIRSLSQPPRQRSLPSLMAFLKGPVGRNVAFICCGQSQGNWRNPWLTAAAVT